MKMIVTTTLRLERPDGTITEVTETIPESVGDNPRFEGKEAARLIEVVASHVLDKFAYYGSADDVLERCNQLLFQQSEGRSERAVRRHAVPLLGELDGLVDLAAPDEVRVREMKERIGREVFGVEGAL